MPSKPNYNHQRAERNRAKLAKKEEKLLAKKDNAARKASQTNEPDAVDQPAAIELSETEGGPAGEAG